MNATYNLCRDCGLYSSTNKCSACNSLNIISHEEIKILNIAHIDCDSFFCSVEKRDNPEIRNKPVIVGGGKRGVVSAACYNARIYGVRSAMPMYQALKLCPSAVVITGNIQKYKKVGLLIKSMMQELTPLVEPLSIDEAFLDLKGTKKIHKMDPCQVLVRLQNNIINEVGITVSVGLSYNKFLAKTASDLNKPNGFAIIGKNEAINFLSEKPVSFIYGVGPSFENKLKQVGINKISDIRTWTDKEMFIKFGESGLRIAKLARAEDKRPVKSHKKRKSISSETTFNNDISSLDKLSDILWKVSLATADRSKSLNLAGYTITLKLKTSNFKTITRRRTLPQGTQLADTIFNTCLPLLEGEAKGQKFRLIGVSISSLSKPLGDHGFLLDPMALKRGKAERVTDSIRSKFGRNSLIKGRQYKL
jgi:DNA polymerase-4